VEIALIDKFVVPEESKAPFFEATRKVQRFYDFAWVRGGFRL